MTSRIDPRYNFRSRSCERPGRSAAGYSTSAAEMARSPAEAIALAIGNQDECDYCQAAHTRGMTNDEMIALRRGEVAFDPKRDALLNLAREYTAKIGNNTNAAWQVAIDAGWSDEQLTELSTHVTLNLPTNYLNHRAHSELDGQPAPAL